jgi:hypothetical protein
VRADLAALRGGMCVSRGECCVPGAPRKHNHHHTVAARVHDCITMYCTHQHSCTRQQLLRLIMCLSYALPSTQFSPFDKFSLAGGGESLPWRSQGLRWHLCGVRQFQHTRVTCDANAAQDMVLLEACRGLMVTRSSCSQSEAAMATAFCRLLRFGTS